MLWLFLSEQETPFFVRELTRKIGAQINAVRNELGNLVDMDLLEVVEDGGGEDDDAPRGRSAQQRSRQGAAENRGAERHEQRRATSQEGVVVLRAAVSEVRWASLPRAA